MSDESMELTEREVAIAEGRDPDAVEPEAEAPEAPEPEPPEADETPSEEAPPETPPEEPEVPEPPEWMTDEYRALASTYGMEDSDIAQFESPTDFSRACRLIDKHLSRGRKQAEPEPAKEPEPAAPAKKLAPSTPTPEDDLTIDLDKYQDYDPDTLRIIKAAKKLQDDNKALRDEFSGVSTTFQEALAQMRAERQAEAAQRAQEANERDLVAFHEIMDAMPADLFGGDGKLTPDLDARRKQVWEAYHTVREFAINTAERDGRPAKLPPMSALVRRAANLAFGDEMIEAERKKLHRGIQEQARRRRPVPGKGKAKGAPGKSAEGPRTTTELAKQIVNDPEIAALFDGFEEANGNAPQ